MENKKNILDSIFKNEDEDSIEKKINDLTPEETKVALEVLEEEIDGTQGDTPSKDIPADPKEGLDTQPEKEEPDTEPDGEGEEERDDDFVIDEDFIEKQPEEDRGILNKYLGKGVKEIAMAVANAIAVKNPILKDDKEAIKALGERFANTKSKEELIGKLISSQRMVGEKTQASKPKLELPSIPDDNKFSEILEKETLKRLKSKYPTMPDVDSMSDEDYKEWRRDLDIENPDHNFKGDKAQVQDEVKSELRKLFLVEKELRNLYDDNPREVLEVLNEDTYPRLKALNDKPVEVLFEDLKQEVEKIRKELQVNGLTEEDLGIDLTITKDENGYPFNKVINSLVILGKTPDGQPIISDNIIGRKGKTFWLIPNQIKDVFMKRYSNKIMTALIDKRVRDDRLRREELRGDAIVQPKSTGGGVAKIASVDDIAKETNPERIKNILSELEKQF